MPNVIVCCAGSGEHLSRAYTQASTPLSRARMCKGVLDKLQLGAEVQSGYCKGALVSKPVAPYTAGHENVGKAPSPRGLYYFPIDCCHLCSVTPKIGEQHKSTLM
jgi:hypothetical protein